MYTLNELNVVFVPTQLFEKAISCLTEALSNPNTVVPPPVHQPYRARKKKPSLTSYPKISLLDISGLMNPLLRTALTEIYHKFANTDPHLMTKSDMAKYILACGASEQDAHMDRINTIFMTFGRAGGEILDCDRFIAFYREACHERPDAVWNDLKVHGYRADLKRSSIFSCFFIDGF